MKEELRAQAIKLRTQQRLSLREIHKRTGASKGSLSTWLRPYPLTPEEQRDKRISKLQGRPSKQRHPRGEPSRLATMAVEGFSPLEQAKVAETAVLLRCVLRRYNVYGSPFDGDKADWIVEVPQGALQKVQVRSCYSSRRGGAPLISLRRTLRGGRHMRFKQGDFDFIVGYDLHTDTAFVYSWEEVAHLKDSVCAKADHAERFEKFERPKTALQK